MQLYLCVQHSTATMAYSSVLLATTRLQRSVLMRIHMLCTIKFSCVQFSRKNRVTVSIQSNNMPQAQLYETAQNLLDYLRPRYSASGLARHTLKRARAMYKLRLTLSDQMNSSSKEPISNSLSEASTSLDLTVNVVSFTLSREQLLRIMSSCLLAGA